MDEAVQAPGAAPAPDAGLTGGAALASLVALEEIRRLKHRYLRCVDLKLWDELADTFTADATAHYGTPAMGEPLNLSGRDEIVGFMRGHLGPDIITEHFAAQPEIDVNGDTATGTWCFEDTVIATGLPLRDQGRGILRGPLRPLPGRPVADRAHRLHPHLRDDAVPGRPAQPQIHRQPVGRRNSAVSSWSPVVAGDHKPTALMDFTPRAVRRRCASAPPSRPAAARRPLR